MSRVLTIEDDAITAQEIVAELGSHGLHVDWVAEGREGLVRAASGDYDVITLDRMLPGLDGLAIVTTLRRIGVATPVLMLSALSDVDERVRGLRAGGDDYLTKPFALQALEARLRALIRRERRQVGSEVLTGAALVLDPGSMRATRAGTELQLSPIGLRLLTILMRESPRVVTRQELEREIWGNGLPDSDTLRSHLYNLRKIIDKPFDRPLLHTVQSAGYRIADIAQPMA
ncbi:hypothetical protein G6F59_013834 [Rhizopus arrhizus]|nr:hypothetical protein G6F59_013834 [Rhizopus arrhizus]